MPFSWLKKVGVYSPYLDTIGGGERYALTFADCFSSFCSVDLLLDSHLSKLNKEELAKVLAGRLGIDIHKIGLVDAPLGAGTSFFERFFFLKRYQVLFYLTDGSLFANPTRDGFLHFQVPYQKKTPHSLLWRKKLNSWQHKICNSRFTKKIIDQVWEIDTEVVYPPVDTQAFYQKEKENIIISVGRFFDFLHAKRHDVMIEAFREMCQRGVVDWQLVLIGGSRPEDAEQIKRLQEMSQGYPISIIQNPNYSTLREWYARSKIYWHAAGFGVDEERHPEQVEHFGIATVEAMASGCVPVVINMGGQPEIVEHDKSGYLWDTVEELMSLTKKLIEWNTARENMAHGAVERSRVFSKERFCQQITKLLHE